MVNHQVQDIAAGINFAISENILQLSCSLSKGWFLENAYNEASHSEFPNTSHANPEESEF